VTSIGSSVFEGCSALSSIDLPQKLISMGENAFRNCTSLRSIEIPGSLDELDYCTFQGCTNLETVILNEGLEEISFGVLGSQKLTKLIIPKSVTYIHSEAFEYGYGSNRVPCSNIVFYCRATSLPSNWQTGWNIGRPIIWGYSESTFTNPTYYFNTNGGSTVLTQTTLEVETAPVSVRSGYALVGWYDNPELSGNPVKFPYYSASKTTLYAKWLPESEYYTGISMEQAYRAATNSPIMINFTASGQKIYYHFVAMQTKTYTLNSLDGAAIYCYLYDADGKQLSSAYSYGSSNISLSYDLVAGQSYYIMVKPYSSYSYPSEQITLIIA
jgi:hypothetical protein